jgi:hypothetical protein
MRRSSSPENVALPHPIGLTDVIGGVFTLDQRGIPGIRAEHPGQSWNS